MSRSVRLAVTGTSLALMLALGSSATAQDLTVIETMDYSGTLGGKEGGAGWRGPWMGVSFDSLVSWWPLDLNARDAGPLGADGILTDGVFTLETPAGSVWSTHSLTFTTSPRTLFDLSAHTASIGSLLRGSLSAWVKTTTTGPIMVIFGAANSGNGDNLQLMVQGGVLKYEVRSGVPTGPNLDTNVNIADGLWHHVAVTVDDTMFARVYVDGAVKASGSEGFIGHVIGVDGVWIGRSKTTAGFTRYWQGEVDDMAIWGNTLTDQDIQTLASLPPGLVTGPAATTGPALVSGSLGSASLPSGAYNTFGLQPEGNRLSESQGFPTIRELKTPLNLKSNSTTYMSFLLRRTGANPSAAEIHFTDATDVRCRVGWDSQQFLVAGIQNVTTGPWVQPDTTYFAVAKIAAGDPGPDQMFVRLYAPSETVDGVEPTAAWSIISAPEAHTNNLNALWIKPLGTGGTMEVDEIRFGKTWKSVTNLGYGVGCQGSFIRKSGRPAIDSNGYSIRLNGASPNASAFLSLGISRSMWGITPLPLNLSIIGGNGCSVLASREITVGGLTTTGTGFASLNLQIPNVPTLAGQTLFAQWASLALSSPNPLKLAFSDGMEVLIER